MPNAPAKAKPKAAPTKYIVLRGVQHEDKTLWERVNDEPIEARGERQARKKAGIKDNEASVAIPLRSWKPEVLRIKQKPIESFERLDL